MIVAEVLIKERRSNDNDGDKVKSRPKTGPNKSKDVNGCLCVKGESCSLI
jgi:hypothetical protein